MTREELIARLEKVEFCAVPTVMTMDMGLEYDYITPNGAGSCLGRIGEWPAYRIRNIKEDRWKYIVEKLNGNCLIEDDFQDTDIATLLHSLHRIYGDMYKDFYSNPNETFAGLDTLPRVLPESFYCIWDIRAWGEYPRFFADRAEFLKEFENEYCYDVTPWDELDDEDLEMWLSRTEDDLAEFPINEFEDDEE